MAQVTRTMTTTVRTHPPERVSLASAMLRAAERAWEKLHGPVDWEKFPTIRLPGAEQTRLANADPDAYLAGLHPAHLELLQDMFAVAEGLSVAHEIKPSLRLVLERAAGRLERS